MYESGRSPSRLREILVLSRNYVTQLSCCCHVVFIAGAYQVATIDLSGQQIMTIEPNYRFLAEKLRDFAERLRHSNEDVFDKSDRRNKRVDEIEWCIQGLDGYCS